MFILKTLFRFSRERDLLRDETSMLSTDLIAAKSELSDLERQLSHQVEMTRRCQSETVTAITEAKLKVQETEQELQRAKEVKMDSCICVVLFYFQLNGTFKKTECRYI